MSPDTVSSAPRPPLLGARAACAPFAAFAAFGIFWGAEGAGVSWPGNDAAIIGVLAFVLAISLALVTVLRQRVAAVPTGVAS